MKNNLTRGMILALGISAIASQNAFATGYEKSVNWSGRYSSVAGIGQMAQGAEALYFNPAGLAGNKGQEVSFNLSPTSATETAPLTGNNTSTTTDNSVQPIYGLLYNYNITPEIGIGVGTYIGAGASVVYDNVSFPTSSMYTKFNGTIIDQEYSVGVGYQVMPGLKIGAAWRGSKVTGELASGKSTSVPSIGGTLYTYFDNAQLSSDLIHSWRLGVQYAPEKNWGIGLDYRSAVYFTAKGFTQATYRVVGGVYNGLNGNISTDNITTATSSIPQQLSFGGFCEISPVWKAYAGLDWTQYSQNQAINLGGWYKNPLTSARTQLPDIQQQQNDQYSWRIAGEYMGFNWPVRFGYVYQNRSENPEVARGTLWAPGVNQALVVGTGHQVIENLKVDLGVEYSWASATVSSTTQSGDTNLGDYTTTAYALHTGLTYNF